MKTYEKPIIKINEELAEGIYLASGCFVATAEVVQSPELGMNCFCIQMNASHNAEDNHHSSNQVFEIVFNQNVVYKTSNAISVKGSGSNILTLEYSYHANGVENIGLGNLYVESDAGLTVLSIRNVSCNLDCGIH